jgi:predicted transcriptional regulator
MAKRPVSKVTDAELRVLEALWELGPSTIRRLTDHLYAGGGQSSYGTVQKLLERLEEENPPLVARDRSALSHVFVAALSRDEFVGGQLQGVADRLCGGSVAPLLTHLINSGSLTETERKELWRLLNAHRKSKS